jgi:hypothetical protein
MTTWVIFDSGAVIGTDAETAGRGFTAVGGRVSIVEGVAVTTGVAVKEGRAVRVGGSIMLSTKPDSLGGADNWTES